jgi:hypothetical protein
MLVPMPVDGKTSRSVSSFAPMKIEFHLTVLLL